MSPQPDAGLGGKLTIDSNLEGGDFSGRRLSYLSVVGARLTHCRFERMRIEQAYLGSGGAASTYVGCSFDGSSFDILFAGFARFERCSFRNANIGKWKGETAELVDCVFTGRIKQAVFWGRFPHDPERAIESDARMAEKFGPGPQTDEYRALMRRPRNEFRGNDFSGADLVDVAFRGSIDLTAQRLPEGGDYLYLPNAAAAIGHGRDLVVRWADDSRRAEALRILDVLQTGADAGQREILTRERYYRRGGNPDVIREVFNLLRSFRD